MGTNIQTELDHDQLNDDSTWLDRMTKINIQQRLLNAKLSERPVARWNFFTKTNERPYNTTQDWQVLWDESAKLLDQFAKNFGSQSVRMTICKVSSFKDIPSLEYRSHFEGLHARLENLQQLAPFVFEQLAKRNFNPIEIEVIFSIGGFIKFNKEDVWYSNLFELSIGTGIEIRVRNFVFLPNHSITRQKHYELWAENAPRLAQCVNVILQNPSFELGADRDLDDYGIYDSENPKYLFNYRLDGIDWNESYIPYELLKPVQ